MKSNKGLYIHIPFCHQICKYCDFFKMVSSKDKQQEYITYLIEDLKNSIDDCVDTIYLGGGTPSMLELDLLEGLLVAVEEVTKNANILEYTIELNPEDINLELIKVLKKFKINRLSIGIQTFNKRLQKIIGRYSDYEDLQRKIMLLRENGYDNISLDLMYGISNETVEEVVEDLYQFLTLNPQHISTYSLILEEKTILHHQYLKGEFLLCDEDIESLMYEKIREILKKHNFIHYETSNFGLNNYLSLHNMIYWDNGEYYGIGAGASGYLNNIRFKNTTKLIDYYQGIKEKQKKFDEYEILTLEEQRDNAIMLGLRKIVGIDLTVFKTKYNVSLFDAYPQVMRLIKQGFLEIDNNHLKIKEEHHYISNAILVEIL